MFEDIYILDDFALASFEVELRRSLLPLSLSVFPVIRYDHSVVLIKRNNDWLWEETCYELLIDDV